MSEIIVEPNSGSDLSN